MSLDIFQAWYTLGGSQSPPTITDLYNIPAWLRKDFVYIYGVIGEARDKARKERKQRERNKPKPLTSGRRKR